MSDFEEIWYDQAEFQREIGRVPPVDEKELIQFVKEMVLHMHSESDELLRTLGAWKVHRRLPELITINRPAAKIELVDMFKYTILCCQALGFTPAEMYDAFWTKSMVNRQRFSEEFVQDLTGDVVVVDIDGVLADYVRGFTLWAYNRRFITTAAMEEVLQKDFIWAEDLGMPPERYAEIKHLFRQSAEHRYLPIQYGAHEFLQWIKYTVKASIVLLTARPIHKYPHLHGDTLLWLERSKLPFSQVWWAHNKGEELVRRKHHILFAVDDEFQYIEQYREQGIQAFHLRPKMPRQNLMLEHGEANTFDDIRDAYETYVKERP